MPTPSQLRKDIDLRLETVPDAFFAAVDIAQDELFAAINKLILELDTFDGLVVNNSRNVQLLSSLDGLITQVLRGGAYYAGLTTYGAEFIVQGGLVAEWFNTTTDLFTAKEAYTNTLKRSSAAAIDKFTESAVDNVFNKPLKDLINQSITSGASTTQITESVQQFIKGNDQVDGKLLRYSKQIGRDAFSASDRQLTEFIADDLGMIWYLYAGDTVKDSREFCIARVGKYFHRNEISDWHTLTWQGKAPVNSGTIFVLLGGYNCLHVVLPVTIDQVPQDVINRNIANGNFQNS